MGELANYDSGTMQLVLYQQVPQSFLNYLLMEKGEMTIETPAVRTSLLVRVVGGLLCSFTIPLCDWLARRGADATRTLIC